MELSIREQHINKRKNRTFSVKAGAAALRRSSIPPIWVLRYKAVRTLDNFTIKASALCEQELTKPINLSWMAALVMVSLLSIFNMGRLNFIEKSPVFYLPGEGLTLPSSENIADSYMSQFSMDSYLLGSTGDLIPGLQDSTVLDEELKITSFNAQDYRVRNGDVISQIAQNFGIRMDTLISFNQINDVRRLQIGTVLRIPNIDGVSYKVKKGDSPASLSAQYDIDVNKIIDANNLESDHLTAGDVLFIPEARMGIVELKKALGDLFLYPTNGRLTSRFGWRSDPFSGVRSFHNGLDLANNTGTSIKASMGGRVKELGYHSGYGKYIIISHAGGFQTLYAHMSGFNARKGQYISQGQKIGRMGSTGYSTGSHLHFSIFKNNRAVNPLIYLH